MTSNRFLLFAVWLLTTLLAAAQTAPVTITGFSNTWNVTEGASKAGRGVSTNVSANATIHAGSSRTFGCTAIGAFAVDATNFTFNGLIPEGNIAPLGIGESAAAEGNVTASRVLTVILSSAAVGAVAVDRATTGGTAVAGEDRTTSSGSLSFAPGELSKTIAVAVLGDAVEEEGESFSVVLSNAVGARIIKAKGVSGGAVIGRDPGGDGSLVFTVSSPPRRVPVFYRIEASFP